MQTRRSARSGLLRVRLITLLAACLSIAALAPVKDALGDTKPAKLFEREDTIDVTMTAPWRELVRDQRYQGDYPATIEFSDELGNRPASNGGDAGDVALGGGFFHARPVDERWGWGLSLASISAAVLEYDDPDNFAGRYYATV